MTKKITKEKKTKKRTFEEVSNEIFGDEETAQNTLAYMKALANSNGWQILCDLISSYKEQAEYELNSTPITADNINEKEWLRKEKLIWDNIMALPGVIISAHEKGNPEDIENFDPYN